MASVEQADKDFPDGVGSLAEFGRKAVQFTRYCYQWKNSQRRMRVLRSVTLYPPTPSRPRSWLLVGKAWDDGQRLVSFYRSTHPFTALLGFFASVAAGKDSWKPDTWADS